MPAGVVGYMLPVWNDSTPIGGAFGIKRIAGKAASRSSGG